VLPPDPAPDPPGGDADDASTARRRETPAISDRSQASAPSRWLRGHGRTPAPKHVPNSLVIAAGWSWRILLVVAVVALIVIGLQAISMIVVPLAVAMLVTAILAPLVRVLHRRVGLPLSLAALLAVVLLIIVVAALLTFAGAQIASGMSGMLEQARSGLDKIINWLHTGPLQLSDAQLQHYIDTAKQSLSGSSGSWVTRGTQWATSAGHFVAGILIALFGSVFFLAQGERIAVFLISMLPRPAQEPTYQAGRRGWVSLTSYVRVQIIVAAVDAIGIGIGALILQLPFVVALTLLVFLTSFIPIVGAIASGAVAVLVALVTHGPVAALIMLGVVLLVQQVESHALQPVLMGRAVALHPLAVLIAVVIGSALLGVVGALFAVPALAVANSMIRYFYGHDPFPELGGDPITPGLRSGWPRAADPPPSAPDAATAGQPPR
jgi:predicted PurR-regulated permease PerM